MVQKKSILARFVICSLLLSFLAVEEVSSQNEYPDLKAIESTLTTLKGKHAGVFDFKTIGTSPGKRPVFLAKIGKGDEDFKPGIAFVASIDGAHPAGTYAMIKLIEKILGSEEWKAKLENNYLYFVPVLSPDAYAQYFADVKYEKLYNDRSTDLDRDGLINEDPFDDLNKDGYITQMRVLNPGGLYVEDSTFSGLLVEWDKKSTGKNRYSIYTEGIDNDKDGQLNEDGIGGVNLNQNFSYDYQPFAAGAGDHAVSEPENIALLDYLFDKWNIYAVFTFGIENTLSEPIKHDKSKLAKRVITGPYELDGKTNEMVSEFYNSSKALKDPISQSPGKGSFSQWAYFHYGRYSYSTPIWVAPVIVQDTTQAENAEKPGKGKGAPSKGKDNYDIRYLKWAESIGLNNVFILWSNYTHPDFHDASVQIGGFKPFVRFNPPVSYIDSTIEVHNDFFLKFVDAMPKLEFFNLKTETLGNQLYRITGKVVNSGLMPTHTTLGDRTRWVRKIRNRVVLSGGQQMITGDHRIFYESIAPGQSVDFSWVIKGKGEVKLEAGSPMTGIIQKTLNLN